jgi:uncharacterized protein
MNEESERWLRFAHEDLQIEPVMTALRQQLGEDLVAVVLFGSRARNDHRLDSDWDLLVIAHGLPQKSFERHLFLKRLLPPAWRGRVSILAKTPAEFEAHVPALFLDIAIDGIILHDTDAYATKRLGRLRQLIHEQGLYRERRAKNFVWQWQDFPGLRHQLTWEGVT